MDGARTQAKGLFDGFREALASFPCAAEAVHPRIDVMAVGLVEGWGLFEIGLMAVHAPRQQPLLDQLAEQVCMRSFSRPDDGAPHGHSVSFELPKNVVHDLLNGASSNLSTAHRTVGFADARPEKSKIILDFRDRRHGRSRVV